ncbi:MAG: signal recognition particle-docking protein FtsY [Nitrospinaceae bacterium]|nr:signal recognition particle-docking protein FtsY [Nitrospinaceae bacterium]
MNESTSEKPTEDKGGFFKSLKKGLTKTRNSLAGGLDNLVHGKSKLGPELVDEIEETLLLADVGVATTQQIVDELNRQIGEARIRDREGILTQLRQMMVQLFEKNYQDRDYASHSPFVVLVIGVNGSGKTTTIGKLAQRWQNEGKKVMLAAGDTFRAAAIEQLQMWADRIGIPCVKQKSGADPSAVAYDGVQAAVARKMDIVIVDTAGRLQTNANLMEELKKVKRVIGKVLPDAPHETLLVLDATIGQNSISQAKLFHEALEIDGLVMTKLDGTSRGGVLLNIAQELNLPVRFIGIGEKPEDLQEFQADAFVQALFEE